MVSAVDLRYMLEDYCLSACPSPHSSVRYLDSTCGVLVLSVVLKTGSSSNAIIYRSFILVWHVFMSILLI